MARPQSRHPTELELEILKILWERGPLSGQEVRKALAGFRKLAYTSVMTIMGIMEGKGYLRRKKVRARFIYSARVSEQATTKRILKDVVHRVFDGSVAAVMVRLLETSDLDPEELEKLRELIKRKTEEESA